MINQYSDSDVFERLQKTGIWVRPNVKNTWALHHDNALCNTIISVNEILASKIFLQSSVSFDPLSLFSHGEI